jgi:methylenetetrahydrofolate reductase (NADPH)
MEHSKKELSIILERYKKAGVENILALRGDPPLNATVQLSQGELVYASELVELAKQVGNFCVAVAAHPEGHPLSLDLTQDRYRLSQKLDKADFAITQFFFNPQYYFDLVDSLRVLGVDKPVIPGIMPIVNLRTVFKMSELSGTSVPKEILARLQAVGANPDDLRRVGVEIAVDLCEQLLQAGVPGLHFYTMNSFVSTKEIYEALGLGARRSKS